MTVAAVQKNMEPALLRDLVALTKPRVTQLVVFTGLVGLNLAPGPIPRQAYARMGRRP